jgi:hypothetical protein
MALIPLSETKFFTPSVTHSLTYPLAHLLTHFFSVSVMKKGGKQGKQGSGRDPNAGRKISKNQINTSGRRSCAAGKKKKVSE